jgi:hypothetical protein
MSVTTARFRNMRSVKMTVVATALMLVSACTTAVTATKPFDRNVQHGLKISQVSVDARPGSGATTTLVAALRSAVLQQLSAKGISGENANLFIVISKAVLKSSRNRAMIGAFAGSNKLDVTATIKSQSGGKVLAEFDVKGDYNPGGFGAFSNPETSTAESVAEALVAEIYKN